MNSPANLSEQQRQFLEAKATEYGFTGDTRTVFLMRFNQNENKLNTELARFIPWSRTQEDGAQKLQDELKKICQVLQQDGCQIGKPKRGRQPKGKSPWELALKWLWQNKFLEWQQSQTINADNSETNSIEERYCYFRATSNFDSLEPLERKSRIQVLEEIAGDSPRYHWKVMEFLAAFIRNATPRQGEEGIPDDIQAALTVIGRRDIEKDPENQKLDLINVNIAGANLREANLQNTNLLEANLQNTNLIKANLQGVVLERANLQRAQLGRANLKEVELGNANLVFTNLIETDLQGANICGADLQYALLYKANLKGVELRGAKLYRANLQGASLEDTNLTIEQIKNAVGDSKTILPKHIERPVHWNR